MSLLHNFPGEPQPGRDEKGNDGFGNVSMPGAPRAHVSVVAGKAGALTVAGGVCVAGGAKGASHAAPPEKSSPVVSSNGRVENGE
jgi:hypothetical protein